MADEVEVAKTKTKTKTKKSAKKAAAKPAATTSRGAAYTTTANGQKVNAKELGAQESVLFGAFQKKNPVSVAQLAASAGAKVQTTQDPKRVVAFYMAKWVRDGLVKKVA